MSLLTEVKESTWAQHKAIYLKRFVDEVPTEPLESFQDYSLAVQYIDWLQSGDEPCLGPMEVVFCNLDGRYYVMPKLESSN